jgi:hypothetical protein
MTPDVELQTKSSLSKHDQQPLRVVYIAGVGRSGSTVLDGVLGNHPLIQSIGELRRLANDAWIQDFYCSCGKRAKDCPFWVAVHHTWRDLNGRVTIQEYLGMQNKVKRFRQWPFLLHESWNNRHTFQLYAEQTFLLLKAIQMISGCMTIVDSSKGVERAYVLSLIPGIDLKVIQLVRDPRGVVWSYKKALMKDLENGLRRDIYPQPAWRTALSWCRMNLLADWLRRQVGPEKALLVRYEDFMLDTRTVLERIGNFIGADMASLQRVIDEGEKLYFGHTAAGNRVRMQGELKLKFDQEWTQKLPPQDRRMTEILSGWLMTRYGYES